MSQYILRLWQRHNTTVVLSEETPQLSPSLASMPLHNANQSIIVTPPQGDLAKWCALHSLSHPSIRAARKLIASQFVWPCVFADIGRWTKSCLQCQLSKIHRHTKAPLSKFPLSTAHFDNIHNRYCGPSPAFSGIHIF